MANIYQISQDLLAIFDEIEDNGGELTPELEEALYITKEEFKNKIKSYTDVIKLVEADITAIKEEKLRLSNLQQSKEKLAERLKQIVIDAVDKFGDTTKAGGKFVDYGLGKVSIKTTKAVDVEEDSVNRITNRLMCGLKWYAENNQLDSSIINPNDVIDYVNSPSLTEEEEGYEIDKISVEDLKLLVASVNFDIDFNTMLYSKKGVDLIKTLLDYNIFKVKTKVDKVGVKDITKSNSEHMPTYAKVVTNKSLIIK